MKKTLMSLLMFFMLVSMACSFSSLPIVGGGSAQEAARPTSPFEAGEQAATATPGAKTVGKVYDDFTALDDAWGDIETVTTQGKTGSETSQISYADGRLTFKFLAKETYAYRFYRDTIGSDVVIEAKYQAGGHVNNGIALVCRVNEAHTAWYELRLHSTNQWEIYRFDATRRDVGKNMYMQLDNGGADINTLFPSRENVVRFTCDGSTLTAGANGTELVTVIDDDLTEGEQAGIGAMSTDALPISIMFDYVSMEKP